jgi:hypothetical protein
MLLSWGRSGLSSSDRLCDSNMLFLNFSFFLVSVLVVMRDTLLAKKSLYLTSRN